MLPRAYIFRLIRKVEIGIAHTFEAPRGQLSFLLARLTRHGIRRFSNSRNIASTAFIIRTLFFTTERWVPHISLVFREMWDTTNLNVLG